MWQLWSAPARTYGTDVEILNLHSVKDVYLKLIAHFYEFIVS